MPADTLSHHLENREEDVRTYVRRKRVALAHEIKSRKKVYLDTKYWVLLRDVRLGRSKCDAAPELLRRLEVLVEDGAIICPLNADVFFEVLKQKDSSTLTATVHLLDDLSLGVSLIPVLQRIDLEVFHFLDSSRFGPKATYDIDELVWTKAAYVLGFVTPDCHTLSQDMNAAVQKAFCDHMWDLGLTDMLDVMGTRVAARIGTAFPDVSDELNRGKFAHLHEHASFKSLFLAEVCGVLDACMSEFSELMQYIFTRDTGTELREAERCNDNSGRLLADAIYNVFRLNRDANRFPTIRVRAGLHEAMRWDRKSRFKPNDTCDFRHAEAALPYCDYFLTERSLCSLLQNRNLGFDRIFRCRTFHALADALGALARIGG